MNYLEFYKEAKRRLTDGLVSLWAFGHAEEQESLRELLDEKEPLVAEPIFQTIFPWKASEKTFEEHVGKTFGLDKDFVEALSNIQGEFCFPKDRKPYRHQSESWKKMLVDKKTIVVTSGTGSGKTECFIIPVLQDLYRERCKKDFSEGVQAIFLYPLNALMKNQRERIHRWSQSLPKPIRYAIYNGEMLESGKVQGEEPQVLTRKEMRENPPQILFTNPTMLNYMLVRSSDQPILENSQGRLRWILLDEAHTYSGSSAAELSLQIRRVIGAFGVTIDQVNFAVTSATIGGKEAEEKLKRVVSQLTGKDPSEITVINGQRFVPKLDNDDLEKHLFEINQKHQCHLTVSSVEKMRQKLNESSSLSASEIGKIAKLDSDSLEEQLSLIDELGNKTLSENRLALLPTRAHFFIRAINGIYSCVNPKCRPQGDRLGLGNFTTYQSAKCPRCGGNMVEIASCSNCGELLIVGENHTTKGYRLRMNEITLDENPFETDLGKFENDAEEENNSIQNNAKGGWNRFVCGNSREKNPRGIKSKFFEFDASRKVPLSENRLNDTMTLVFQEVLDPKTGQDVCPCCGKKIGNKLKYLRASADLLGRFLVSTVLDNAMPMDEKSLSKDKDILYDGKKFISFTDSRQGTAKSALGINQDMERNWIRSSIYHNLAIRRQEKSIPQGLTPVEQMEYNFYKQQKILIPFQKSRFDILSAKLKGNPNRPAELVSWEEIKKEMASDADSERLYLHLQNARFNTTNSANRNDKDSYLTALFLEQFGWIPRTGNTLENLGLVHLVYPRLLTERIPAGIGASLKSLQPAFTDDDWRDFLKICVDYQIRGARHYCVPEQSIPFLVQEHYFAKDIYDFESQLKAPKYEKWPQVHTDAKGEVNSQQSKLVLLLIAGLGLDKNQISSNCNLINVVLQEAWKKIRDNMLKATDIQNHGYRLDLLDKERVKLQIVEKGWKCPVDNVVVDTLFRGYSPRMRGMISNENFARFHVDVEHPMIFPYFPYAGGKKVSEQGEKSSISENEVRDWIKVVHFFQQKNLNS